MCYIMCISEYDEYYKKFQFIVNKEMSIIVWQGSVAESIRPCNRTIASSIPVYGRFATPFSKEFYLTILTMVTLATATAALRAVWDKVS